MKILLLLYTFLTFLNPYCLSYLPLFSQFISSLLSSSFGLLIILSSNLHIPGNQPFSLSFLVIMLTFIILTVLKNVCALYDNRNHYLNMINQKNNPIIFSYHSFIHQNCPFISVSMCQKHNQLTHHLCLPTDVLWRACGDPLVESLSPTRCDLHSPQPSLQDVNTACRLSVGIRV